VGSLRVDVRHAVRSLGASPGFVVVAVLCLGLGIGLNAATFSVVNGLLLRPLPFHEPARLVTVGEVRRDAPGQSGPVSYPNFRDWRDAGASIAEWAVIARGDVTVGNTGPRAEQAGRHVGARVTLNLFQMVGMTPALGRGLREDDIGDGSTPVVVLSDALWRQRYAGDTAVIGQSITVDGAPRTVVGVMPPFDHPGLDGVWRSVRVWLPLDPVTEDGRRDQRTMRAYARLAAGIGPADAQTRLDAIARQLEATHRENDGWKIRVRSVDASVSPNIQALLTVATGAVGFVLLIVCVNVANLMLARATRRQREIGIRLSLGASRGRIVRQLLVESACLGVASLPLGLFLAWCGIDLLLWASPFEQASTLQLPIDGRVLAYTTGLSLVTSLVFGLAPAVAAVRGNPLGAVRSSGREATAGRSQTRLRHSLVVAEVAISMILLVGGSLFTRSFVNMLEAEGNFDIEPLLTLQLDLGADRYAAPGAALEALNRVVARLSALPGVEAVAASSFMPLRRGGGRAAAVVDGVGANGDAVPILRGGVTPGYFDAIDMPLLQGRAFTAAEGRNRSAVAIVNRRMVDQLWPDGTALGERFRLVEDRDGPWYTVVGISRDIATWDLSSRPRPGAYLPYPHVAATIPLVLVRSAGNPTNLGGPARAAIREFDANLPVVNVRTMDAIHRETFWRQRLAVGSFSLFGLVAVFLAAIGVYGVLSNVVSERTREIGVRMAVGASHGDVIGLVVRQGMALAVAGIVFGLAGSLMITRVLRGQLYQVTTTDPLSLMGTALLLAAIGWCASYAPARRAAGTDPMVSLRE
jgi:putative ABC transport system permease protein